MPGGQCAYSYMLHACMACGECTITVLDACRWGCTDLDLVLHKTASLRQCQHRTLERSSKCVWALKKRHLEACMGLISQTTSFFLFFQPLRSLGIVVLDMLETKEKKTSAWHSSSSTQQQLHQPIPPPAEPNAEV
ncbi:hypothetical protein OPV22_016228 [Ensete ventricosum]|uniref:Uncharacterized protein n=1 Tax=Ensete ventricosum TaxID=4639 RepID=A0AAV8QTA6_ENSVE|nr:hypothetical protein OPV22_016228 [Ensete ventricosum]